MGFFGKIVFFPSIWVATNCSAVTHASIEITILSKEPFLRHCENAAITHILSVLLFPRSQIFLPCHSCGAQGRCPSRLLPQLYSGTPACSGGTQCCCGDSKELPGRVRRGPGELQDVPAPTLLFLFQSWQVMLPSDKGRPGQINKRNEISADD